jgi:hypothetical protein
MELVVNGSDNNELRMGMGRAPDRQKELRRPQHRKAKLMVHANVTSGQDILMVVADDEKLPALLAGMKHFLAMLSRIRGGW